MSKTVEVTGDGLKVVDTVLGVQASLLLKSSISITSATFFQDLALATGVASSIMGGITTVKVLAGVASVATVIALSGGQTVTVLGPWVLTSTTGWTTATLTQSSGGTVNDDVLSAG